MSESGVAAVMAVPALLTRERYTPRRGRASRLAAVTQRDYRSPNPTRGHAHAGPPDPFARKFRRQPEIRSAPRQGDRGGAARLYRLRRRHDGGGGAGGVAAAPP